MDFGDRLRRLRMSQRLTVRELGRLVGVSGSYITQLENKECKPSFSTLKKLAEVLGTSIDVLTEDGLPDEWVVSRREDRKYLFTELSGWHIELITFTGNRDKRMQSCLVRLEQGASGPNTIFSHDREDFIFVVSGALKVTSGQREYVLRVGDAAYFNFHRPEHFANSCPGETVFLWVVSPGW